MNFYFLALVPLIIGGIIWIFDKHVNWQEWAIGSASAFILAVIFHIVSIHGMTDDVETWSGQITQARHFARWHEYYEFAVYRTEYYTVSVSNSNGKGSHSETRSRQVFDHWEGTTCWHDDFWECYSDLGTTYSIEDGKYQYFTQKYEMNHAIAGNRTTGEHNSRMIGGDPNDYIADTTITRWIEPITLKRHWTNKVKAAPSVFSFTTVPTNIPVFTWPENPNPFVSDRVVGTARKYVSTLQWDKLNAQLGAGKKINLIIIGFDSNDSMLGQYQQAKFIGGKKNDIVITVGGKDLTKPKWCFTFGWSDSDVCKSDISAFVMKNGLSSTNLFSFLHDEVIRNYTIKEWKQFDYLRVEPAACYYYWFIGVMLVTQIGLYWYFNVNEFDQDGKSNSKPNPYAGYRNPYNSSRFPRR
jgi:hypothetical protein